MHTVTHYGTPEHWNVLTT